MPVSAQTQSPMQSCRSLHPLSI